MSLQPGFSLPMLDLKTKLLITIGAVFLLSFGILTYLDYQNTRKAIVLELVNEARLIRGMMAATRRVYRHQFMISGIPLNDKTVGLLPAHALSRISEEFKQSITSGLSFNNVSDRPRNPDLLADNIEMEAIQYFRRNADVDERMVPFTAKGKPFYHFASPIWVTKDCLLCHGKQENAPSSIRALYKNAYEYKLGELRGILSIKLPAEEMEKRAITQLWNSSFSYLFGFIVTFLAVFLLIKQTLLTRITRLTKATSELAGGNYAARLTTRGNDEIAQVSSAFNAMAEAIQNRTDDLEESELRTRAIVEAAGDGILLIDSDGIIRDFNPAAGRIFGFTSRTIIGKPLALLLPNEISLSSKEGLKELFCLSDGCQYNQERIEVTGQHRDGSLLPIDLIMTPVQIRDEQLYLAMVQDISIRKEAELAVQQKQEFLQSVIDGVIDPIMVIRSDYQIIMMNKAARKNLPDTSIPDGHYFCYQVSHGRETPCSGENHPCPLKEVMTTSKPVTLIHEHQCGSGGTRLYELDASPYQGNDGQLIGIIETSKDITERLATERQLRENEAQLRHQAHHDALTGLPNRVLFHDRLDHAMRKAHRVNRQVAVLFLDLDRFKNINDGLGHDVGDGMLKEVALRLQEAIRGDDTVARLGGDEFVIILEELLDPGSAASVATKCLKSLSKKMVIKGIEIFPTVSIGISLFPDDDVSVDGLMKCADAAMYRAKDAGRNTFQFYTSDMNDQTIRLLLLEGSLRHALDEEQLQLYYQPKFDITNRRLIGMEALIRWHHPEKGLISPADFIPLAEDTGMIVSIGEWVIKTACKQLALWKGTEFRHLHIAVNISARHFNKSLLKTIARELSTNNLSPDLLELEITESVLMDNADAAVKTLTQIRDMGISLAIDDFGTGYSSLSYLKRFPISSLKIDRSFVKDVIEDNNDAAIVTSIVALAKHMDLMVTAEGVETEEQLAFIKKLGCDYGQGYLLGRPVPVNEFESRYLIKRPNYLKPVTEKQP
ncbi:MAG: EAL domain-containing protein [Sedimenticola sp.]|nr:EAL domain-containing protein [Sedimenticola sp.]